MRTDPNDPASPCQSDLHGRQHKGLTKREEFTKAAMQSLIRKLDAGVSEQYLAERSVEIADALINQLNFEKET